MRVANTNYRIILAVLAATVVVFASISCEDNPVDKKEVETGPIVITEIIASPKSPEPGDTVAFTAVVTGPEQNEGDFPRISWTATGGAFLETNLQTVHWVAPAQSSIYTVNCTATNSVNSASNDLQIFVEQTELLVASGGGMIGLESDDDSFFFVETTLGATKGRLYEYTGGATSKVSDNTFNGTAYTFAPDLSGAAFTQRVPNPVSSALISIEVFYEDLVTRTWQRVTNDDRPANIRRRNENTVPLFSPDGQLLAWSAYRPGPVAVEPDTFDVAVFNKLTGTYERVTKTHGRFRYNYFPTFSSDQKWLFFVSDRNRRATWDFYALPVNGTTVTTDSAATTRMTSTGGLIATGTTVALGRPLMSWNGNASMPVMAHFNNAGDGLVRLIQPHATGATVTEVGGVQGTVQEFTWSQDGTILAACAGPELYVIEMDGTATLVRELSPGDAVRDVVWSADKLWMIYRVTRSTAAWFELFDYNAGKLSVPLVFLSRFVAGEVGTYRGAMRMNPALTASGIFTAAVWPAGQSTPAIHRIDLSNVVE